MNSSFKLPMRKKVRKNKKDEPDSLILLQADGSIIITAGPDKRNLSNQLDYIVQAINSHELHKKLVAMIKQWQAEEFWNENPKLVMETLWSALKEAEKSND